MQTMGCCLAGGGGRGGGGKGDSADAVAGDGGGGDGDGAGFRLNAEIIKFDSLKLTKHLLTFLSGWRGRSMSRHRTVSSPDFTIQCIERRTLSLSCHKTHNSPRMRVSGSSCAARPPRLAPS